MSGPTTCLSCGGLASAHWTSAYDREYRTTQQRFDYWFCRACDCLVIDPVPIDEVEEIYPANYYSFTDAGDQTAHRESVVRRVKAWLDDRTFRRALAATGASSPRILDVGGGNGDVAAAILTSAAAGATARVVDFNAESTAIAAARGLDVTTCKFEDFETEERFDLILMLNLVEHVADPVATMRKAGGLLAPGGVLWVQTPNFRALDARIFRHRNWGGLHCPRHWVIYSRRGLEAALGRAGLEPIEMRTTQGGAFWATSALGVLRELRPLPGADARSLLEEPLFLPLAGVGAAFDLLTSPLRDASQIRLLARARRP